MFVYALLRPRQNANRVTLIFTGAVWRLFLLSGKDILSCPWNCFEQLMAVACPQNEVSVFGGMNANL